MSFPFGTGDTCFVHHCSSCEFHIPVPGFCNKYDCLPGLVDDPKCRSEKQLKLDL